MNEIWILGAAGRIGAAVTQRLAAAQLPLVLVGRDEARLRALADSLSAQARLVAAGSLEAVIAEISRGGPAVVVNTIGPSSRTALPIARACAPGAHYVDLCNDPSPLMALLGLHDEAVATGRTLVTGAGFGVLAAESVLLKLCEGRLPAARARVDMAPAIESEDGLMGASFAATIVDVLAAGGRTYENHRLVPGRLGDHPQRLTLPDGSVVQTGSGPSGELEVAHRITGAPFVVAASTAAPTSAVARAILPAVSAVLRVPAVGAFATGRIAAVRTKAQPRARADSWAHARVEWASGEVREGWLRAGEGMAFTAAVCAEVVRRLTQGQGRPGAFTPGALFGPELAVDAGGQFVFD